MASGTGIRAAAILMAGLVGAAVIAPGVAFAQADGATPDCATQGLVLTEAGTCESAVPPAVTQSETPVPDAGSTGSGTGTGTASGGGSSSGTTGSTGGTGSTTTSPLEPTTSPSTEKQAADTAAAAPTAAKAAPVTTAAVTDSLAGLTGFQLPSGLPITDALKNLPLGNLDLGGVTIPTLPSSGSFTSPRDACLFLASRVTVPVDAVSAISGQFASFCNALPGSFEPSSGYPDLPSLAHALDRLCHGLKDTHYHHTDGRDDINCDEVSYDQAQQILAEDRSDPNNLDGDNDGEACEDNPRGYETVAADYDGYPQGGVATGDSAPGLEPGIAGALAGLALATVAGTAGRRDEREDAARREELVER